MSAIFDLLYRVSVLGHVTMGFIGLAAFWVPLFLRKGGRSHVLAGRIFAVAAYGMLALAGSAILYRMLRPFGPGGPPIELTAERTAELAAQIRGSRIFLAYICVIVLASIRQGILAARTRRAPELMRRPSQLALAWISIASSLGVITLALATDTPFRWLFLALGPVGLLGGRGMLRFMHEPRTTPMAWWYEHMSSMLGAGIGFHTAFAVFGASRLFRLDAADGPLGVLPWVLPFLIGVPAQVLWVRHYRRRFGELPHPEALTSEA